MSINVQDNGDDTATLTFGAVSGTAPAPGIYATSTDLATWTGTTAPANADQLLRSASLLVREATACDFYPVDDNGMPTAAATAQAMNDAACCHAALWAALGVNPLAGAAQARIQASKSIGSASISYADAAAAAEAAAESLRALCPEARRILRIASLGSTAAWIIG